jgi:hypothetical protein
MVLLKMPRNILQISIKDGDSELNALADFLRGQSITIKSIEALRGYYHSLSVAESTGSSREQRDKALHLSVSLLKQQICFIMDYHFRLDGTILTPDLFGTVVINSIAPNYPSGLLDRSIPPAIPTAYKETEGARLIRENQQRENEINRELEDKKLDPENPPLGIKSGSDGDKSEEIIASSDNSEEQELSEEDLDNMTDEEYKIAMAGVIGRPVMKS